MAIRMASALALATCICATGAADDGPPPEGGGAGRGEIKLDNPNISGTGPYNVVVKGTLSIDKDTTGFVGTKASVKGTIFTYNAAVSLPKGNPESGKGTVSVEYTFSKMPNKGTYNGDAVLEYKDSNGDTKATKANIMFEIK